MRLRISVDGSGTAVSAPPPLTVLLATKRSVLECRRCPRAVAVHIDDFNKSSESLSKSECIDLYSLKSDSAVINAEMSATVTLPSRLMSPGRKFVSKSTARRRNKVGSCSTRAD